MATCGNLHVAEARPVATKRVWQIRDGNRSEDDVEMVLEEPLSLHINRQQVAVLMRLPGMEKELAAGFCVSEALVHSFSDILTIHYCGQGLPSPDASAPETSFESRNRVEVLTRPGALNPDARLELVRLIRAGCGAVDIDRAEVALSAVGDGLTVDWQVVQGLAKAMRAAQELHRRVGGLHAAALFDATGKLVTLCEDVGRHNAVDKAIGHCLLHRLPLTDKLLLCSGRLSYEMVTKTIRLSIPLLASFSAPTALAVELAERFKLTLVGYLRGRRMTIYTHPQRLKLP